MLLDEKWNEQEKSTKVMEKTWTIVFPFQEADQMLSQIYELRPLLKTEVLQETKMGVSSHNAVGENGETN